MERAEEKPVSAYKDIRTQKQGKISLPAAMSNNVLNNNIDYVSNSIALIPLPDSTSYNLALLAFNANKFDSCTMYLTAIIANKTTVFYEQALNLLAKTYLKQHKKAAAKKVLNDLKYFKINKQKAAE
jgi:hypothetical protein